jgi:hypothetical protein
MFYFHDTSGFSTPIGKFKTIGHIFPKVAYTRRDTAWFIEWMDFTAPDSVH